MKLAVKSAGRSHIGLVRAENEDAWSIDANLGLYVISDGVGGGPEGALAAQMVTETLPCLLRQHLSRAVGDESCVPSERSAADFASLLVALNADFLTALQARPDLAGMGATVVAAWIDDNYLHLGHLGDSRAYILHAGQWECLTVDHTLAETLLRAGALSPEDAREQSRRSPLVRFIGMSGEVLPGLHSRKLSVGDRLLLCTDGLWGMVEAKALTQLLADAATPQEACDRLVNAALAAGGRDNITAVALFIFEATLPEPTAQNVTAERNTANSN